MVHYFKSLFDIVFSKLTKFQIENKIFLVFIVLNHSNRILFANRISC
jgi:hypothetical protein